jgi:hypothetical protein
VDHHAESLTAGPEVKYIRSKTVVELAAVPPNMDAASERTTQILEESHHECAALHE